MKRIHRPTKTSFIGKSQILKTLLVEKFLLHKFLLQKFLPQKFLLQKFVLQKFLLQKFLLQIFLPQKFLLQKFIPTPKTFSLSVTRSKLVSVIKIPDYLGMNSILKDALCMRHSSPNPAQMLKSQKNTTHEVSVVLKIFLKYHLK